MSRGTVLKEQVEHAKRKAAVEQHRWLLDLMLPVDAEMALLLARYENCHAEDKESIADRMCELDEALEKGDARPEAPYAPFDEIADRKRWLTADKMLLRVAKLGERHLVNTACYIWRKHYQADPVGTPEPSIEFWENLRRDMIIADLHPVMLECGRRGLNWARAALEGSNTFERIVLAKGQDISEAKYLSAVADFCPVVDT